MNYDILLYGALAICALFVLGHLQVARLTVEASRVVCRRSDGTYWTPAGDSPFPFRGYNFVPAVQKRLWRIGPNTWYRNMEGERWFTCDNREFETVFVRKNVVLHETDAPEVRCGCLQNGRRLGTLKRHPD